MAVTDDYDDTPPLPPPHLQVVTEVQQRALPDDAAAEAALLGAMLLDPRTIDIAAAICGPDDHARNSHAHIHAAILELHADGETVTTVTVAGLLRDHGLLAEAGGEGYLVTLQSSTPATSAAATYARRVADKATLRRLIHLGEEIREAGYTGDTARIAEHADAATELIDRQARTTRTVRLGDTLDDYLDLLDARNASDAVGGLATGLHDLDHLTGGFRPGQLIVIAGRPGMGKSDLGVQILLNAASDGHPVHVTSIEMSLVELQDRFMSSASRVDYGRLRDGTMTTRDWEMTGTATRALVDLPLHLLDDPAAGVTTVRTEARKIPGLALVVIDYLQLLAATTGRRDRNREQEVAEFSRNLKRLARDLDVPVVALCQLNRNLEARSDKRPQLADLRESGAIENDADTVVGLYRDDYYKPDSPDRGILELIVLKQRAGATGTVKVHYQPAVKKIANLARST